MSGVGQMYGRIRSAARSTSAREIVIADVVKVL
jgi:hypothetical protein